MVFHRFRWIAGFAGLARLARLAGRFGFLALLEASLKHVVSHARRQDGSADKIEKSFDMNFISIKSMKRTFDHFFIFR